MSDFYNFIISSLCLYSSLLVCFTHFLIGTHLFVSYSYYPFLQGSADRQCCSISIYPEDECDKRRVCHSYLYIIYIYTPGCSRRGGTCEHTNSNMRFCTFNAEIYCLSVYTILSFLFLAIVKCGHSFPHVFLTEL